VLPQRAAVLDLPQRRSPARAALVALRPRQWTKNLLLFAGIVFAAQLGDGWRWLDALAAFAAYCAASSAAYLVNDLRDAPSDRLHPLKRSRPIATGEVDPATAVVVAVTLALAALALGAAIGPLTVLYVLAFLALQASYTLRLKNVVLVDVFAIASLFVLRAAAGAQAVAVAISPWLLLCTGFLALFLGFAKRRAEIVASPTRTVLAEYPLALVDQLLTVVAASTITAYGIYAFAARPSHAMMATIPFVLFGVMRYLLLVHQRGVSEEPDRLLLTDRHLLASVAGFVLVAVVVLQVA
jgi:4-hydroxybenzoate polyprenyltransferase